MTMSNHFYLLMSRFQPSRGSNVCFSRISDQPWLLEPFSILLPPLALKRYIKQNHEFQYHAYGKKNSFEYLIERYIDLILDIIHVLDIQT